MLDAGTRDAFKEPERVMMLRELQMWLEMQPEVRGTTSMADHLMVVNRAFHGGDPDQFAVPASRSLIGQYLFFLWSDQLEHFVDAKRSAANILVRTPSYDTHVYEKLFERIEVRLQELPPSTSGYVTGNGALVVRTIDDIARGQAVSLSAAILIVYAILALYFRSFRIGLYALIPNALPVVVYFGVLGLTGVTLNIITSLISCIILGIAVDDTIHFLVRFREKARVLGDERKAAAEALRSVARPVTSTTVALSLGFLVLATSGLRHQVEFGWLAASLLAFAWLVDVTFTPALASRMGLGESGGRTEGAP
jgi:predicted RND superfamily exporter protein